MLPRKVNQILSALGLLTLVTLLSSCSLFDSKETITFQTTPIEKPQLILPDVDQLNLEEVQWIVITNENAKDVMAYLNENNYDMVLFGLTDGGYEALSKNTSDIMQMVQQQQSIIKAYKRYYESVDEKIDNANDNIEADREAAKDQSSEQSLWQQITNN